MMKLNSIIYLLSLPLSLPPHRTALSFAGFIRAVANLSAKGFPIGTIHTAVFSGLSAQNLDPLRTARRELVASASTVTARHGCTSMSAPGAMPRPLALCRVTVYTCAQWQNLDPLRTAWRELVSSANNVTTRHLCTHPPLSVKNAPVDNLRSASNLPFAEKIGTVDKVCKCLKSFNIPDNVRKVVHFLYFIRRVLC